MECAHDHRRKNQHRLAARNGGHRPRCGRHGEYASSSEVVRDALRDWTHKRSLRQQGVVELRQVWQEAMRDKRPGADVDDVLDRLERKYQAIADAAGPAK